MANWGKHPSSRIIKNNNSAGPLAPTRILLVDRCRRSTLGGIAETKGLCSRNVDDELELCGFQNRHWEVFSCALR